MGVRGGAPLAAVFSLGSVGWELLDCKPLPLQMLEEEGLILGVQAFTLVNSVLWSLAFPSCACVCVCLCLNNIITALFTSIRIYLFNL